MHHLLSITHIQSQATLYIPCKQAVICRNGADTGSILAHYGMFSRHRMWWGLTTKICHQTLHKKRHLNDTTQHVYCVTQPLTRQSRTKRELFCWRFLMHLLVWKVLYCDFNFTEVYPKVPIPINEKSTMLVQIMAPLLAPLEPHIINNELWKCCYNSCYFEWC